MASAWNELGDEYATSETVVIADVDCTKDESKALCQKLGVGGYPTIKYFTGATAADGEKYSGGRDYASLSTWAKDNLGPSCDPENIEFCDDTQKAAMKAKQALSDSQLDAEIEAIETEIKDADVELELILKSLQATYEESKKKKDEIIATKSPTLTLLLSVKRAKAAGKVPCECGQDPCECGKADAKTEL
jgi:protein disulfide-isomerase A6